MQGDVFGLRATLVEVREFVRRGAACLHFLAVLSGNAGHASLLGWLRKHGAVGEGPGRKAPLLGLVQKRQQSLWETKAENQLSITQTVSG